MNIIEGFLPPFFREGLMAGNREGISYQTCSTLMKC